MEEVSLTFGYDESATFLPSFTEDDLAIFQHVETFVGCVDHVTALHSGLPQTCGWIELSGSVDSQANTISVVASGVSTFALGFETMSAPAVPSASSGALGLLAAALGWMGLRFRRRRRMRPQSARP